MDLLLRDIDPIIVKQIDEWAKEHNRSRQQYLKELLASWCANGIQSTQVERLERQLEVERARLKEITKAFMNAALAEATAELGQGASNEAVQNRTMAIFNEKYAVLVK